jgi:hypothetical protein
MWRSGEARGEPGQARPRLGLRGSAFSVFQTDAARDRSQFDPNETFPRLRSLGGWPRSSLTIP